MIWCWKRIKLGDISGNSAAKRSGLGKRRVEFGERLEQGMEII
jgi:hypothetical protein